MLKTRCLFLSLRDDRSVGWMIEIYIYCSIKHSFATMTKRDGGQMGTIICAVLGPGAQRGRFFIMTCVAIYRAVLVGQIASGSNFHVAIWQCAGYGAAVLLPVQDRSSQQAHIRAH